MVFGEGFDLTKHFQCKAIDEKWRNNKITKILDIASLLVFEIRISSAHVVLMPVNNLGCFYVTIAESVMGWVYESHIRELEGDKIREKGARGQK